VEIGGDVEMKNNWARKKRKGAKAQGKIRSIPTFASLY